MTQNDNSGQWSSSSDSKTTTTSSGEGGGVSRIFTAWRALCESFLPPLGYEDETGFHYGDRPKSE